MRFCRSASFPTRNRVTYPSELYDNEISAGNQRRGLLYMALGRGVVGAAKDSGEGSRLVVAGSLLGRWMACTGAEK